MLSKIQKPTPSLNCYIDWIDEFQYTLSMYLTTYKKLGYGQCKVCKSSGFKRLFQMIDYYNKDC